MVELEHANRPRRQNILVRTILYKRVFDGEVVLEGVHLSDRPSLVIEAQPPGQPQDLLDVIAVGPDAMSYAADLRKSRSFGSAVATADAEPRFGPLAGSPGSYFGWARPEDGILIADARPRQCRCILTALRAIASHRFAIIG